MIKQSVYFAISMRTDGHLGDISWCLFSWKYYVGRLTIILIWRIGCPERSIYALAFMCYSTVTLFEKRNTLKPAKWLQAAYLNFWANWIRSCHILFIDGHLFSWYRSRGPHQTLDLNQTKISWQHSWPSLTFPSLEI